MKITVTQDDINSGTKCAGTSCPIALAARRVLSDEYIHVEYDSIFASDSGGDNERVYDLPSVCGEFIEAFDGDETVEPFEFEFEVANAWTW